MTTDRRYATVEGRPAFYREAGPDGLAGLSPGLLGQLGITLLSVGLALLAWTRQAEGDLTGVPYSMGEAARLALDPDIETRAAIPGLAEPLSSRELQVLRLLAAGRANRDIAAELVVTLHTVKRHVTHILAKLGAVNRTEAAARARELNLIP